MKQIKYILMLFLCVICLCSAGAGRAEAASGSNLIRQVSAKTTPKGKWVKSSAGYHYRYTATGKYARKTWLLIRGKLYYFDSKGCRVTGMKKYKGQYYFLNAKGVLKTGWKTVGGRKYYFSTRTGAALTGWKNIKELRYYFNEKGVMQKGCWVDDCYLGADGIMARDTVVDGYYVDHDGRRTVVNLEDGQPEEQPAKYIFVGDSRTVGMQNTIGDDSVYIGKVGEGYQWFSGEGIRQLKRALKKTPYAKVILNLGVNDLANISNYIACYQNLIYQYPQARFYFLSVNPIEQKLAKASGYSTAIVSNAKIQTFNASMQAAFPGAYLDCYNYLTGQGLIRNVKAGAGTVDGIHYTSSVYRAIYHFVISATG